MSDFRTGFGSKGEKKKGFLLGFFPHNPPHGGTGCSWYPPGKAPIKWSSQAARSFGALPAFKRHFWSHKSCPFLPGGAAQHRAHPREGKGITKRGYPDIPCATSWKIPYFHNSHNSQPQRPRETHPHPGAPPRSRATVAGPAWGSTLAPIRLRSNEPGVRRCRSQRQPAFVGAREAEGCPGLAPASAIMSCEKRSPH